MAVFCLMTGIILFNFIRSKLVNILKQKKVYAAISFHTGILAKKEIFSKYSKMCSFLSNLRV
jgi:hypothetical protein